MKKIISYLVLTTLLLSLCGCGKKEAAVNTPKADTKTQTEVLPTEITLDTEGYEVVSPIMCGDFANNLAHLEQMSDYIFVVTPNEKFDLCEIKGNGRIRSCTVNEVLKGDCTDKEIPIYEPAYIKNNQIVLESYTPIMTKGFKYIVFCHKSLNDENLFVPHFYGGYCLYTDVNDKNEITKQRIYAEVLEKYKNYFYGSDFRISDDTKTPFTTKLAYYSDKIKVTFEGETYINFDDRPWRDFWSFFPYGTEYTYTGKKTDEGFCVYKISDDILGGKILFILIGGNLCPIIKESEDVNEISFDDFYFKGKEIVALNIYEKGNTENCYQVPQNEAKALAERLTSETFEKDSSDDYIEDTAYMLEFKDSEGFYYRGILYVDKNKLFGRSVTKEITDSILALVKEEYKAQYRLLTTF